ncbi:MAG: hypothetical protein L0Y38_00915 [Methylococcaceae bacterium]|nr:hypothetical protein [Methylococcaceae bacterium]
MYKTDRKQSWRGALSNRGVWWRACKLGLSVGFLQAIINQGDYWLNHAVSPMVAIKTLLTPLITFSVALVSAAATHVEKHRNDKK